MLRGGVDAGRAKSTAELAHMASGGQSADERQSPPWALLGFMQLCHVVIFGTL